MAPLSSEANSASMISAARLSWISGIPMEEQIVDSSIGETAKTKRPVQLHRPFHLVAGGGFEPPTFGL